MKPKVYIETSIVSYLTARPSGDLIVAAHQKVTQDWWENQRDFFELYSSQVVFDEAKSGDPLAAARRLQALQAIPLLEINDQVEPIAKRLITLGALPAKAQEDASHVAIATVHDMNYLLTWNCSHLANAQILLAVQRINDQSGYRTPLICTPLQLLGGQLYVD